MSDTSVLRIKETKRRHTGERQVKADYTTSEENQRVAATGKENYDGDVPLPDNIKWQSGTKTCVVNTCATHSNLCEAVP
ncbi:hypothetical protein BaRGS_00000644 [Batillaria attramentaria]|uniref:Uncharacterized protein n=1 Tax=Batillaria attramentaria TaxID=370345 RepID=A0ABD0M9U7_9CAEN